MYFCVSESIEKRKLRFTLALANMKSNSRKCRETRSFLSKHRNRKILKLLICLTFRSIFDFKLFSSRKENAIAECGMFEPFSLACPHIG